MRRKSLRQVYLSRLLISLPIVLVLIYANFLSRDHRADRVMNWAKEYFDSTIEERLNDYQNMNVMDEKVRFQYDLSLIESDFSFICPGYSVDAFLTDHKGELVFNDFLAVYLIVEYFNYADDHYGYEDEYYCMDMDYLLSYPEMKEYLRFYEERRKGSYLQWWLNDDNQQYKLELLDGYVDPVTRKFYPGNCILKSYTLDSEKIDKNNWNSVQKNVVEKRLDLTPRDVTGLIKYQFDEKIDLENLNGREMICHYVNCIGSTDYYKDVEIKKHEGDHVEHLSKIFVDGSGEAYMIHLYLNDNKHAVYFSALVVRVIVLLIIDFLICFIWASIIYGKLRYFYRNEDYRKALMNSMAHDLRTPLTVMSGYAENLCENVQTDKREHYARSILENVNYMNGIVSDISDLSKLEESGISGKREKTDLCRILTELKEEHAVLLKEKELNLSIDGSFKSKIEEASMKRALDNLLVNAIRYSPKGGTILIVGRAIPILKHELYIENQFEDHIKVKTEKLWEPFVKGDESRSNRNGTGLGLSIARGILENQGFKAKIRINGKRFSVSVRK